jgi:hypothetical protein
MFPRRSPRIDILKAHSKVLFYRFIGGAFMSGLMMFIGWAAVFPGYLIEDDTSLAARIFIFGMAFFFDAIFITSMYRIYCELSRLRTEIRYSSKQRNG